MTTPSINAADEKAKVQELRALIEPAVQDSPELQRWCTDECLRRFLRSRNMNVPKAEKKLLATLEWRKAYKPEDIVWSDVEAEAKTGKLFLLEATDRAGRPIVLMRPRCENTKAPEGQIKNLVYTLELASRRADASGVEKIAVLIDFEGYSIRNAPPFQTSRETLHILQGHYPERLGIAVCFHPPTLFSMFWKAISPFIDPVTYNKIQFSSKGAKGSETMESLFDMSQLEECLGGKQPPAFDLAQYSSRRQAEEALKGPQPTHAAASNTIAVPAV